MFEKDQIYGGASATRSTSKGEREQQWGLGSMHIRSYDVICHITKIQVGLRVPRPGTCDDLSQNRCHLVTAMDVKY
jgi:hypothetical protein